VEQYGIRSVDWRLCDGKRILGGAAMGRRTVDVGAGRLGAEDCVAAMGTGDGRRPRWTAAFNAVGRWDGRSASYGGGLAL
jgi:hypothetical protein